MKQLNKIIFITLIYLTTSFCLKAQTYGTFIHEVDEDTYIRGGENSDLNYGSELELLAKGTPSNENNYRKTILKFDLSDTSYNLSGSAKAVLRLHANDSELATINAYELDDAWLESTVTWDNVPTIGGQIASVVMGDSGMYYEWDITSYVQTQLSGDKIVSIALGDPDESKITIGFNSKEGGLNIPHIAITIDDPNLSAISASQDSEIFYWGRPSYDKNYGDSDNLSVRYDDNVSSCTDSYIQFDISSITGAREKILLKLYAFEVERASEISVYGTATEATWSETTITGASKPLATERIDIYSIFSTGFVTLDVTNYVNKAIEAGWDDLTLIVKENEGAKISFNSKEATSDGPQLMVSSNSGSYVAPTTMFGTFYFDSENGDDNNNGTSEATAWQNLTKLEGVTLAPGSQILLKRGSVWSRQEIVFKGSGTDGNPIVIDAYSTGDKPLLKGLGQSTGLIKLFNQEYIEISNIHITNLGLEKDGLRRGIHVVADNFGVLHHLHFSNLKFTDINGTDGLDAGVYANTDDEKRSGAILLEIRGDDVQTYFDDILLDKTYFYDVSNTGFANISHWSDLELNSDFSSNTVPGTLDEHYIHNFVPSKNVVIKRNRFENINSQGMIIRTAENPIMEYNLFYYCSIGRGSDNACFNSKTTGAVWRYNESCFTEYTEGKSDGAGIDADLRSKNTLIEYNYCHNNEYGGVITTGGSFGGSFNDNTIIRYNVLINNGINSIRICNQNTNLYVHNNLVYYDDASKDNSLVFTHLSNVTPQGPINSVVTNNIFYTTNNNGTFTADVEATDTRFEEVKYSNNLYYGIDATYQYPNDANLVTADPLFENGTVPVQDIGGYVLLDTDGLPTGSVSYDFLNGFGLSESSPAIDAGSTNTITEIPLVDFQNQSLYKGVSLDIGPFESDFDLALNEKNDVNQFLSLSNPVSNEMKINMLSDVEVEKISIYNTVGQLVTVFNKPSTSISLDDLRLQKGIYLVKLDGDFGTVIKRILKE
ncbi:CBM96 family carbohydrate-binding protein [Flavivirga jejuensis]|uniref:DNRLRE domain-containing protein n=1 Tax=Flavivirga jejuensis TaxID=870487 RepID=A0ABT8WMC5_9FLAO|nr:DNRLRE domain-containing protein [Flavivirga jejuensis]MDO5974273.1 DNRLRE domain-containing protein [Flavivirga jejuensis]